MKKMKQLFIFLAGLSLCLLLLVSVSQAACSNFLCNGKITRLYLSGNTLYIATDGDESALSCTAPSNVYVTIQTSDPMFDAKYATLLTAVSLGKDVGLRIIDNDSHCAVSYVYMDN